MISVAVVVGVGVVVFVVVVVCLFFSGGWHYNGYVASVQFSIVVVVSVFYLMLLLFVSPFSSC